MARAAGAARRMGGKIGAEASVAPRRAVEGRGRGTWRQASRTKRGTHGLGLRRVSRETATEAGGAAAASYRCVHSRDREERQSANSPSGWLRDARGTPSRLVAVAGPNCHAEDWTRPGACDPGVGSRRPAPSATVPWARGMKPGMSPLVPRETGLAGAEMASSRGALSGISQAAGSRVVHQVGEARQRGRRGLLAVVRVARSCQSPVSGLAGNPPEGVGWARGHGCHWLLRSARQHSPSQGGCERAPRGMKRHA